MPSEYDRAQAASRALIAAHMRAQRGLPPEAPQQPAADAGPKKDPWFGRMMLKGLDLIFGPDDPFDEGQIIGAGSDDEDEVEVLMEEEDLDDRSNIPASSSQKPKQRKLSQQQKPETPKQRKRSQEPRLQEEQPQTKQQLRKPRGNNEVKLAERDRPDEKNESEEDDENMPLLEDADPPRKKEPKRVQRQSSAKRKPVAGNLDSPNKGGLRRRKAAQEVQEEPEDLDEDELEDLEEEDMSWTGAKKAKAKPRGDKPAKKKTEEKEGRMDLWGMDGCALFCFFQLCLSGFIFSSLYCSVYARDRNFWVPLHEDPVKIIFKDLLR